MALIQRFHEVMAEESQQTVVDGLLPHILPLAEGVKRRLESGIDVLDVACGSGRAMIALGQAYPSSLFTGVDFVAGSRRDGQCRSRAARSAQRPLRAG